MAHSTRTNSTTALTIINKSLPIVKNEDVEFSIEQADADDMEAMKKAQKADAEQQT